MAKFKSPVGASIVLKVSAKGGISIYGLQSKFPVTLYREQLERILSRADGIAAWVEAHADKLSAKPDAVGKPGGDTL